MMKKQRDRKKRCKDLTAECVLVLEPKFAHKISVSVFLVHFTVYFQAWCSSQREEKG